MKDMTNIAVVSTNEELTELYCIDCANELFAGVENVEIQQRYTFENNESDSPTHCPNCFVLLEEDMTDDGLEYVRAEIVAALSERNTIGLDPETAVVEWAARYGQYIENEKDMDAILDPETVKSHYLTALLWTGSIDFMTNTAEFGGESLLSDGILDHYMSVDDLSADITAQAGQDVDAFLDMVGEYLKYWELPDGLTAEQLGHDFSLTRNHHGAGFWDRGWGELGDWLTRCAQSFGDSSLYGSIVLLDPSSNSLEHDNVDMSTLHVYLEG